MSLKLKLGARPQESAAESSPAPAATPSSAGGIPKLKLNISQPPTPSTEYPASATSKKKQQQQPSAARKAGGTKKRTAVEDISPAAKRIANEAAPQRKVSLKLSGKPSRDVATPLSAGAGKIRLVQARKPSQPTKRVTLNTNTVKRPIPRRDMGVGYDSEDSEREEDPAIQQGLILRMQDGDDAKLLHEAIENGKIGINKTEPGAVDASVEWVTADLRRAVVRVQDRLYAAVLVDLPCIVETMKSWDRKGWWKVSDVWQMLLVLGRVKSKEEVKNYPLPREVDKKTMQYAHGLTPPMHYVRKRRFRKRVDYKHMENVEEEVERLLREDEEWEKEHGAAIKVQEYTQAEWERLQNEPEAAQEEYDEDVDADGEVMDSTEYYGEQAEDYDDEDTGDLEAMLAAEMQGGDDSFADTATAVPLGNDLVTESPITMADEVASPAAVYDTIADGAVAATPSSDVQGVITQDEHSSDEDESDYDEDSPDIVDEEAEARAAERKMQLEEVAELEREIAHAKSKLGAMGNQILRGREEKKIGKLVEELGLKKRSFGLAEEED